MFTRSVSHKIIMSGVLSLSHASFSVILPVIYLAAESAVTCVWGLCNNLRSLSVLWIFPSLPRVTKNEYQEAREHFRWFLKEW